MKVMNGSSSNADSMRVLRTKLLLSQSYVASLEFENQTLAQHMQDVELQEISEVKHELVDLTNRLTAWNRIQEESRWKETQLLDQLQRTEEELRLARAYIEESDCKYAELLSYAKENLNQVEKEKAALRRKLARERRKNDTDERSFVTQIFLETDDASTLGIEDDETEVEAITPFLSTRSIEQSTQTDDLIVERNQEAEPLRRISRADRSTDQSTQTDDLFVARNIEDENESLISRDDRRSLRRQSSSMERRENVTAEEAERRPWHKDVGSTQIVHRHVQNQLHRQACELKALRKDRILLQSQLDHCRWLVWDLEEYRNWNRQKSVVHRQHEPFQPLYRAEGVEDLVWQKKMQHFDTLTRFLMKEVDQKNAVISEMSSVCTPMEALSCVHREQERSLKMAAVTSVALAESQMKVDELTAALQKLDVSQRSSSGVRKNNTTASTARNSTSSVVGQGRMGASHKSKSEPFLLFNPTGTSGMLMDFKDSGASETTKAARDSYQAALLRKPSRNKFIMEDPNGTNFNSKIPSLFRSSVIEGTEKRADPATKDLETAIRALQGRIAAHEQDDMAFIVSPRMQPDQKLNILESKVVC
jgi:hypothetical protein